MKKRLALAGVLLALAVPCFSHASVEESDMVLGGLTLGEDAADIQTIYGDSGVLSKNADFFYGTYHFGKSLSIMVDQTKEGDMFVFGVASTAANGVATPQGITVGSSADDVVAAYGEPDRKVRNGRNIDYQYYNTGDHKNSIMYFSIGSDGLVTGLGIHYLTGE